MTHGVPEPVCKAFLVCERVTTDPDAGRHDLLGLPMALQHHQFPTAAMLGFFARLSDAHGEYDVEIQLTDSSGEVVWRDGPPGPLAMDDSLMYYDLLFNLNVVFPSPGDYEFVLVPGGEPVARQRFKVVRESKQRERNQHAEFGCLAESRRLVINPPIGGLFHEPETPSNFGSFPCRENFDEAKEV